MGKSGPIFKRFFFLSIRIVLNLEFTKGTSQNHQEMTQSYPSLLPSRIKLDIARAKVDRFANGFFVCDFDY